MFRKIAMQFQKPTGFLGKVVSFLMINVNRSVYENVIKNLDIQSIDKILEIGYGPGIGINLISKRFATCDIYGIDFSELMFNKAIKLNKQYIDNNKVKLLFGNFNNIDISIKDFDKIYCINVVYFWDNLTESFKKVRSLLKKDGIFYFYMAHKDDLTKLKFTKDDIFNKYSIEQVNDALELAGFKEYAYEFNKGFYIRAKNKVF